MSTGRSDPPDERVAQWVERSCLAQGVPVKVTDPVTVRQVLALLGVSVVSNPAKRRTGPDALKMSPGRDDPLDVEAARTGGARVDGRVIEDGFDDGVLAGKVQPGPLGA